LFYAIGQGVSAIPTGVREELCPEEEYVIRELSLGELLLTIAGILTSIGTIFLAYISFRNIELTKDIYRETNRPWLDVRLVDTEIDENNKQVYVTFQLEVAGTSSPAKFIRCAHWAKPEGSGPWGEV